MQMPQAANVSHYNLCLIKSSDFLVISYAKYKRLIRFRGDRRRVAAYAASASTGPSGIPNASIDPPGLISQSRSQPAPQTQPEPERWRDRRSQREHGPRAGRQSRAGLLQRRVGGLPAGRRHHHVVLPGDRARQRAAE